VVQHSNAVDEIEAAFGEWQLKNIGLKDNGVAVGKVLSSHLRGQTQVYTDYVRAPACCHFRESPHAATYIEDQFSIEFLGAKTSALAECNFGPVAGSIIQLGPRMDLPLKSKTAGIILCVHKSDHAVQGWILPAAPRAH
jgi:hypothetical protein